MPAYKNKESGKWYVVTQYTDWTGARKQKCKRGFDTRREALEWEQKFQQQSAGDLDMSFEAFVEIYTTDLKARLKESTWQTKEHIIQTKIVPYFGKRKINEITTKDVIAWQNELLAYRDEKHKPYSQSYLKTLHNQLSAIFNHAVRFYDLRSNPAAKAGNMRMIDAKEKTALATSVGADERQSFQTSSANIIPTSDTEINHPDENSSENLEEIYRQMQRMNDPAYLHTVSMNDLYETVFQSRPPVIDGLLYSGTYLFAGAPKVGKSFFMAQLAYHISTGKKLWNYDVHQGTVLYLALEDDYQRLQERMSRMFGVEGTDNLHFAVYAKQLGAGLDEQLEKFIRDHPDTRLIIIDTLQKIREVSTDAYSYANDYDIVGRMKQFADKNGVCLLLVHHTRKQQAGDKFEMISGTTGLLGCADGAFLLQKEKRTDLSATLEIVGRDQPDQKLHLTRDAEKLIWQLDHAETELWKKPPDPLLDKIAAVITEDNPVWNGSATELVALLQEDIQPNILTRRLNVKAGDLLNEYGIEYAVKRTRNGSFISLTRKTV